MEIIKKELPLDILELFMLTPLPGSEDHQTLWKKGVWMDPDLNKYDLHHRVVHHPKMSDAEYEQTYRDAWRTYYAPEHIETVARRLLTPCGLRSLSPDHPDYQPRYDGDLHARDAAYHQGTIWAWLIGPFADACRRVHPHDAERLRSVLAGFPRELSRAGVGTISEIFDAEPPYMPRGCIAQAWSVAEVLRVMEAGTRATWPDRSPRPSG